MSRTNRQVDWFLGQPQPLERTWRGLGDRHPFVTENPRNAHTNGYDGANRDGRHPNTLAREKRVQRKVSRRARQWKEEEE